MNRTLYGRIAAMAAIVLFCSALFNWIFQTHSLAAPAVWIRAGLAVVGVALWLVWTSGSKRMGRGAFYGLTSAAATAVVLGILVGVNYFVVKKGKSWDLTKDKIYTLSDETVKTVKGLAQPVNITAFYVPSEPEYSELSARLDQYKALTDKLTVKYIDPVREPAAAKENSITQASPRIIVKSGVKEARAKDAGEESLTNALLEVTHGSTKKLYFTKGHGEHNLTDTSERGFKNLAESLKGEGYLIDEIVIAEHKALPEDMQALIVSGPIAALQDGEIKLVKEWVEKGGKLVAMIDPQSDSGLQPTLASWGFKLQKDIVLDPESQQPQLAIGQQYADHPVTKAGLTSGTMSLFPLARSVSRDSAPPAGWSLLELVKTGPRAWGEMDSAAIAAGGAVEYNKGVDIAGPVPLAVAGTHGAAGQEARVVVVGNSLFAANAFFRIAGNRDLALNAIAWTAKEEGHISIRPKLRASNHLFLSAEQSQRMVLFAFDLLPFGLLFAGLAVWQTRKSR
jgi:ABC-type uncharacterized transport system involved in gliding motility auxiliary subunit